MFVFFWAVSRRRLLPLIPRRQSARYRIYLLWLCSLCTKRSEIPKSKNLKKAKTDSGLLGKSVSVVTMWNSGWAGVKLRAKILHRHLRVNIFKICAQFYFAWPKVSFRIDNRQMWRKGTFFLKRTDFLLYYRYRRYLSEHFSSFLFSLRRLIRLFYRYPIGAHSSSKGWGWLRFIAAYAGLTWDGGCNVPRVKVSAGPTAES